MRLFIQTISLLFLVSTTRADNSVQKYVSQSACTQAFANIQNAPAGATAQSYCADKIMSPLEVCIDNKVKELLSKNKKNSLSDLMTNSEQVSLKNKYNYECQVQAKQQEATTAVAQQQARAQQQGISAGAAAALGVAAGAGVSQGYQNAALAVKVAQEGSKVVDRIDDKVKKVREQQEGSAGATSAAPAAASTTTASGATSASAAPPTSASNGPVYQNGPGDGTYKETVTNADGSQTVKTYKDESGEEVLIRSESIAPQASGSGSTTTESLDSVTKQIEAEQKKLGLSASEAKAAVPGATDQINNLNQNANGNGLFGDKTEITTHSERASNELAKIEEITQNAIYNCQPDLSIGFSMTEMALQQFSSEIKIYLTSLKKTCTNSAEKSSFLCVERTSPGAIAAKEVMNASGPILALISSAQKTCSTTAKITKFVNTGLMVAKGVCVASKIMCDSSCKAANTSIQKISTTDLNSILTALNTDIKKAIITCNSDVTMAKACAASVERKAKTILNLVQTLKPHLDKEAKSPTPGAMPSLVARCQSYGNDIARFTFQALGTWAANQNAQKCADQLAAAGGAGAAVSMQSYCEKAENVSTQVCICQKMPMAQGCPGAVVAATTSTTTTTDAGTNLKGVKGASAFAGGSMKPANGSNPFGSPTSGLQLGQNSAAEASGAAAAKEGSGNAGGSSLGSGEGGSGSLASDSGHGSAHSNNDTPVEKKKWSFGAFMGLGGGSGGFGSSSESANQRNGSGNSKFDVKTAERIQRQIASEKLSAEVSSASGKSNWEKVNTMYLIKENSFLVGQ